MENPNSWSPLTKAVAEAAEKFYRTVAVCEGPEPLEIKASIMADVLAERGILAEADKPRAREVIQQSMEDHRKALASGLCGASEATDVSNALVAAKLAS